MKVLLLNGSPRKEGCTYTALSEIANTLKEEGIDSIIYQIGTETITGCKSCRACAKLGKCVINDKVNEFVELASTCDGFIFGSPVYYSSPSGRIISALNRLFYAGSQHFAFKPASSIVTARRAGTTSSLDVLNKYFLINQMPIVSSTYWNIIFGRTPDELKSDLEGIQTMKFVGKNMAWMLKCINIANCRGEYHPQIENKIHTNFIR